MAVAVKAVKAVKEHKQGCKSHDLWPLMPKIYGLKVNICFGAINLQPYIYSNKFVAINLQS